MRILFVLWTLIVAGLVPAAVWPTSLIGDAPPCPSPSVSHGALRCGGEPAWRTFVRYYSAGTPTSSDDPEGGDAKISNGF